MFFDRAKIYVKSGDGGDGMISFRREKHVPRGGPNGGDGGKGGDIVVVVQSRANSLVRFHRQTHYRADNGKHGGKNRMTGATGEDLILEVPAGTLISDAESNDLLADMVTEGQEFTIAQGGMGGRGNSRFKSSRNQAPRLAERGEPGKSIWLSLELKLIADVGIVGPVYNPSSKFRRSLHGWLSINGDGRHPWTHRRCCRWHRFGTRFFATH